MTETKNYEKLHLKLFTSHRPWTEYDAYTELPKEDGRIEARLERKHPNGLMDVIMYTTDFGAYTEDILAALTKDERESFVAAGYRRDAAKVITTHINGLMKARRNLPGSATTSDLDVLSHQRDNLKGHFDSAYAEILQAHQKINDTRKREAQLAQQQTIDNWLELSAHQA